MRYALIEENRVVNIIEIDPRNANDFKNAVTIPEGVGAGIGDTYRDGRFFRYNEENQQEEEILPHDTATQALNLAYRNAVDLTSVLLDLNRIGQEQTTLLLSK